jgi:hypothetical protein
MAVAMHPPIRAIDEAAMGQAALNLEGANVGVLVLVGDSVVGANVATTRMMSRCRTMRRASCGEKMDILRWFG